ncbi:MAG TPA: NAD(P)/FAD-dependent oxidoreductase [Terriglobia bacterium]|nr:NAD(P)/FAD-dependent oxidoreductase [Terriglobia bacterium]
MDVCVIGAGPAGATAALRAAELGAKTVLITSGAFGGMAANDGPVPVRTLAHAARLLRDARQLGRYGIKVSEPVLDYSDLLDRVREVVEDARAHSSFRELVDSLGVVVHERTGGARFSGPNSVEAKNGLQLKADKFIICTGGTSRRLDVPGAELTATHSDAWGLTSVPPSMLVIGAGATGAQVASIFNAFGCRIQLFQAGPRILPTEDADISSAVAAAFRASGIAVHEAFGEIQSFEKTADGIRMNYTKNGTSNSAEAALAVVAIGWVSNAAELNLTAAGVETDRRGFVKVDGFMRTSAPHVFAAGDVTGGLMLVPQAIQSAFVAATNAVGKSEVKYENRVSPIGSFTDPEYAQVGLTETQARESHDIVKAVLTFDTTTRTIIDGRTAGFCKMIVDRATHKILGCHVMGERAVEITQVASIAIAAGMKVEELAQVPLSFPTYAGILGRVAVKAAHQMNLDMKWVANDVERSRT